MIVSYTFILNLFLVGVNQVTGWKLWFVKQDTFIPDAPLWLKYLLVSVILSLALVLSLISCSRNGGKEKSGAICALACLFIG